MIGEVDRTATVGKPFPMVCLVVLLLSGGCSEVSSHVKRGDELMRSDLHQEALEEYQKALEQHPDDPQIAACMAKARQALGSNANEEGLSALEMNDYSGAIEAFKKAIQYDPREVSFKQNLKQVTDTLMAKGKKAIKQRRYDEAIAILRNLLGELPEHAEAKQYLDEAQSEWADWLYNQAIEYLGRELPGNALVCLIKLKKLTGSYRGSASLEADTRKRIEKVAQLEVNVLPAKVKDLWRQTTNELVERLRTLKVTQCPLELLPISRKPWVSMAVGVEKISFNQSRKESTKQQKYQSGIRKVDNPEFIELEGKIAEGRERISELEGLLKEDDEILERVQQAFADAGPDEDEDSLRSRLKETEKKQAGHQKELAEREDQVLDFRNQLSRIPRKLDEPVFDMYTYRAIEITRTATSQVKVNIYGGEEIEPMAEQVSGSAEVSDITNPAYPKYGVKADPPGFPKSDKQLVEEATLKTAAEIGNLLGKLCEQWQGEILSRARQASSADKVEATEEYLLYLFASTGNPPPEVVDFLQQQQDISDIKELCRKGTEEQP